MIAPHDDAIVVIADAIAFHCIAQLTFTVHSFVPPLLMFLSYRLSNCWRQIVSDLGIFHIIIDGSRVSLYFDDDVVSLLLLLTLSLSLSRFIALHCIANFHPSLFYSSYIIFSLYIGFQSAGDGSDLALLLLYSRLTIFDNDVVSLLLLLLLLLLTLTLTLSRFIALLSLYIILLLMLVEDKQSKHIVAFTILVNNRNNGRYCNNKFIN